MIKRTLTLTEMCQKQNTLNKIIDIKWTKNLCTNDFHTAIVSEFNELLESTNWKWWKKQNQYDSWNMKIEAIDILHFALSCMIIEGNNKSKHILGSDNFNLFPLVDDDTGVISRNKFIGFLSYITTSTGYDSLQYFFTSLNMSSELISSIYVAKYVLNKFRQSDGYMDGTYVKVVDGIEDNVKLESVVNDYLNDSSMSIIEFESLVTYKFFMKSNGIQK